MRSLAISCFVVSFVLAGFAAGSAAAQDGAVATSTQQPGTDFGYFRFVVVPQIDRPDGTEFSCRPPHDASATLAAWAENAWRRAHNRDAQAGVQINFRSSAAVEHTLPIFQLHATDSGRKCSIVTNRAPYQTPLMDVAAQRNVTFNVRALSAIDERLDASLISGAQQAVESLGNFASLPDSASGAIAGFVASQLRNAGRLTPTSDEGYAFGWQSGYMRDQTIDILSLPTRSGNVVVRARVYIERVASVLSQDPGQTSFPNLSITPMETIQRWTIGEAAVAQTVNAQTGGGWDRYGAASTGDRLTQCATVRRGLGDHGFSAPDAVALTWIMMKFWQAQNQPIGRPDCLTSDFGEASLARFGVQLEIAHPPQPTAIAQLIDGGDVQQFFMTASPDTLLRVSNAIFAYEPGRSPAFQDAAGRLFRANTQIVTDATAWVAFRAAPNVRLQCLFGDVPRGSVGIALALAETGVGDPAVVEFQLAPVWSDSDPARISRIDVLTGTRSRQALNRLREIWGPDGHCETSEVRPALIFPPAPSVEPRQ